MSTTACPAADRLNSPEYESWRELWPKSISKLKIASLGAGAGADLIDGNRTQWEKSHEINWQPHDRGAQLP
jgi:hypothetical protein